jgi:hypothetical protein
MKKSYKQLTHRERKTLTDKEYYSYPPEERKECCDCTYLKSKISWWCTNQAAIDWRGTAIPGVALCPFWKSK